MLNFRHMPLFLLLASIIFSPQTRADEKPSTLRIATWNLEWFYDEHQGDNYSKLAKELSAPSRKDWAWKRDAVADAIAQMKPTILALQEVENQQVLYYLCKRLRSEHDLNYRIAFVQGSDFYTEQDVAVLYRTGMVEFGRRLLTDEQFKSDDLYYVSKHQAARFRWGDGDQAVSLSLLNVHLRATPEKADLRQKQMRLAKHWVDEMRSRDRNIVVLGDFNTEEPVRARNGSELAIMQGRETSDGGDDLVDLHGRLPDGHKPATHMIGKIFDRILVSPAMIGGKGGLKLKSVQVRPDLAIQGKPDTDHRDGYYKIPEKERDLSDHYPIIAEFEVK